MTAIVAILNKNGVSIACDRAGSLEDQGTQKVYDNNKLFRVSNINPIGVGIYESSQFMGMPLEVVLKEYRKQEGNKEFDNLSQQVDDIVKFISSIQVNHSFHTEKYVMKFFLIIRKFVNDEIQKNIMAMKSGTIKQEENVKIAEKKISQILSEYSPSNYKRLEGFSDDDLDQHMKKNKKIIQSSIKKIFIDNGLPISQDSINKLVELVKAQYLNNIYNVSYTGLIFTGFGKNDFFPKLKEIIIYSKINDKVTYIYNNEVEISDEHPWEIIPFAQIDMVQNIALGVSPGIDEKVKKDISKYANETFADPKLITGIMTQLNSSLEAGKSSHVHGFRGVMYLPLLELGSTAETLVNLTTFKRRITMEKETVGGNTDVAIISKGDGFIWHKREHYFEKNLNYQFFTNK